jgi:uncharacterized membrane protein
MKKQIITLGFIAIAMAWGCKHEILPDPGTGTPVTPGTPGSTEICFESEVLPIFQSNCAKAGCHDATTHKEGLVLNNYSNIMRNGIVPGNATASTLYKVLYASGESKMPPNGNTPLTDAQKITIGVWINQGAKNTTNCGTVCDANAFAYTANVKPIMTTYCTGCHSGSNASKGIDLSTAAGVKTAASNGRLIGAITHLSGYVAMPQGGAKLNDCQIAVIQKWIAAGAPNN